MVENPLVRPEFGLPSEQVPIFSSSATSLTAKLRSERIKVRTLPTFVSVLCILAAHFLGHLARLLVLPSTTYAIQNINFFIMYSQQANVNMANVSLELLPTFTQTLMFIRCS
jgi:hypothetical protein